MAWHRISRYGSPDGFEEYDLNGDGEGCSLMLRIE